MFISNVINKECSVCLGQIEKKEESLGHKINETCSHIFHKKCLTEWFQSSFTCPICRGPGELFGHEFVPQPSKAQQKTLALYECCIFAFTLLGVMKITENTTMAILKRLFWLRSSY
jgi:hypothetical protein